MRKTKILYYIALVSCSAQAGAQTTNCMGSGSMVHCNTIGSQGIASTDCMIMGNMATCNTIGGASASSDSGPSAAEGIASFIKSMNENNLRKKIGTMIANGDCRGAYDYALRKGRLEMGSAIARSCQSAMAPAANGTQSIAPAMDIEIQKLIDSGDCKGAVNYAYRLGKISIGDKILKSCPS